MPWELQGIDSNFFFRDLLSWQRLDNTIKKLSTLQIAT